MSLNRVCVLGLLLIGSSTAPGLARQAPPCDVQLVPVAGELGYRRRSARCEGLYRSPISAPSLELVSLYQGVLRFELNPAVRLRLLAPVRAAQLKTEPIRVRAAALPLRTYYRLDATVTPDRPLEWPVADVLLPTKLGDSQVGVFGWIESDVETDRLFVPLRVVAADAADSSASSASTVLVVRSSNDAETILWRSYGESAAGNLPAWTVAATSVIGGHAVSLRLPDGPEAVLWMDVTAKSADSDSWSSLRIRVLRPASP